MIKITNIEVKVDLHNEGNLKASLIVTLDDSIEIDLFIRKNEYGHYITADGLWKVEQLRFVNLDFKKELQRQCLIAYAKQLAQELPEVKQ